MLAAYVPADRRGITPRTVRSSSGISIVPEFDLAHDPEALHFDLVILGAGVIEYSSSNHSKGNTNSNTRDTTTAAAAAMKYVQNHHNRGGRILTYVPVRITLQHSDSSTVAGIIILIRRQQ